MNVSYTGIYINLDRSIERRAAMEAELARHGLGDRYRRFPAADGNILGLPTSLTDSEMGCFTSHYLVVRDNRDCATHLHVVEDDAMFSRLTDRMIRHVVSSNLMGRYDILFLDSVIDPLQEGLPFREYKELYDNCIIRDEHGNVAKVNFTPIEYVGTASSYLVNSNSIGKLLSVYDEALAGGPKDAVDTMIRKKGQAGAIRVGCLFPFLTSIRLDGITSTITGRKSDDLSALAMNLSRHSFFVDCDIRALLDYAEKVLPPTTDPHYRLLGRVLGFSLTSDFHKF
jgi:hypothetical protein